MKYVTHGCVELNQAHFECVVHVKHLVLHMCGQYFVPFEFGVRHVLLFVVLLKPNV